jgi:D-alanine-D-alanine ligase
MKRLRVLVLVREGLVPPDSMEGYSDKEIAEWKCEYDVVSALKTLGHTVHPLGVLDDLGPVRESILEWKPHIAFMLLEEFHGVTTYDHAVVSYLELMRQRYTGSNPLGLMLTRDKALAKKILTFHRIPTPHFAVFPVGRKVRPFKRLKFPLLVKSSVEDASYGIAQASIVQDEEALRERVHFIHESVGSTALVEEYIEGRELYVGVIGNQRLQTFPVWEMVFSKMPEDIHRIATARVKFDRAYQKKHGIDTQAAQDLPTGTAERIARICKRVYRVLQMSGYARMDLRLAKDGRVYVLEANANPNVEFGEDFAESAEVVGISYERLLERIMRLGLRYQAPWQG